MRTGRGPSRAMLMAGGARPVKELRAGMRHTHSSTPKFAPGGVPGRP